VSSSPVFAKSREEAVLRPSTPEDVDGGCGAEIIAPVQVDDGEARDLSQREGEVGLSHPSGAQYEAAAHGTA
jgi:hypothetical protein